MILLLDSISNDQVLEIYENVYRILASEAELDDSINNLHSIDIDKTPNGFLNIVFDYFSRFRVNIYIIDNGDIQVIAPDSLFNRVKSLIQDEYPEYNVIR